ncbi:jg26461 [Pararge aegeria aegeria]|uniref:Jg26461 protein n=1 Tax=Pararge aegeria aegeria TaxID=348720 RepID=A0A8S4QT37_9NEOP|nr:jg26461 [Pararge aegeria aegeria]
MQNKCEYDEDVNFSQMIVPMLRKLNDDQKHFAKIEIMNVLQKAKSFYPFESSIHCQRSKSHVSYTQTPSPQSYYTYSPSPSPTMPIQSPVSTPVPATPSVTKKPQIIHQEIISTGQQTGAQFITGPAKQTIYLPLNTSAPSTSQTPMDSIQILDQSELLQYEQQPTAANYLSQLQEQ